MVLFIILPPFVRSVVIRTYNHNNEGGFVFLPVNRIKKTPSVRKEVLSHAILSSDSGSLVQLLCQAGLFPVGGILVNNALGSSLIDHSGSRGQLLIGFGGISGNSGVKFAYGCTKAALYDTIPQILFLADLHAFLCGLDIRQLGSPPLRMLKNHRSI